MFLLVSLSKSKFFTRVVCVALVPHSCLTCVALVSLVLLSCCIRVAPVARVWHSSWKLDYNFFYIIQEMLERIIAFLTRKIPNVFNKSKRNIGKPDAMRFILELKCKKFSRLQASLQSSLKWMLPKNKKYTAATSTNNLKDTEALNSDCFILRFA